MIKFISNIDLDIIPSPKNLTIKTVRYEDKKLYRAKKEMAKMDHIRNTQINYRATVES